MTDQNDPERAGASSAGPPAEPAASVHPAPVPATPVPPAPLVAWEPPPSVPADLSIASSYAGGPPEFTVGALLSDTFARYGADVLRLFLVSVVASGLSWLSSLLLPATANPIGRPSGFVDLSGLFGLLSFVVGIVGSSTTFALAEGGRAVSFGRALRRGIERAGWLFLTSLLLGVAFFALILIALIPIGLFAIISPVLIVVPLIALALAFLWAAMRLTLALPANVADNLNSIEAVKLSWRATRPSGVWLRILAASLVLGLMVAPAAIGALLLVFPAMFTGGAQLLLLAPAVVFALFTPLSALLAFSAYRRLVPPFHPSWTEPPPAMPVTVPASARAIDAPPPPAPAARPTVDAPALATIDSSAPAPMAAPAPTLAPPVVEAAATTLAPETAAADASPPAAIDAPGPAFRVPRLGRAGKALIALVLAFDVAGVAAIPYGVARMEQFVRDGFPGFPGAPGSPGFPGFPTGNAPVFPGQVAFGSAANLDDCTMDNQLLFVTAGTPIEWLAAFERQVTPQDEVFVRITRDGQVLDTALQEPGTYDCLGNDTPDSGLVAGIYTYEVLVNGSVSATGSLIVQ